MSGRAPAIAPRRSRRRAAVAVVAAACVVGAAFPAAASTPRLAPSLDYGQTQWYYTAFKMSQNLATANGSGITVGLIDSRIDPSVPELAGADLQVQPTTCVGSDGTTSSTGTGTSASHGTEMAVMLLGNGTGNWNGVGGQGVAPGATVRYYPIGSDTADSHQFTCGNGDGTGASNSDEVTAAAIDDAIAHGARVISMSFGGGRSNAVQASVLAGLQKGVVFVAGTDDHDGAPIDDDYPVGYNGVVAVNGIGSDGALIDKSVLSNLVTVAAPGRDVGVGGFLDSAWDSSVSIGGSSPATAWTAGVIADAMSKWPNASGNQVLQLLARTTGGTVRDLATRNDDGFGYGVPSLTAMLVTDPSQYPDQNPLLRDDAQPTTAQIAGQATSAAPTTSPGSSSSPVAAAPAATSGGGAGVWIGIAVGVAVLVVLAVVVLLLRRRRRGDSTGGSPPPLVGAAP